MVWISYSLETDIPTDLERTLHSYVIQGFSLHSSTLVYRVTCLKLCQHTSWSLRFRGILSIYPRRIGRREKPYLATKGYGTFTYAFQHRQKILELKHYFLCLLVLIKLCMLSICSDQQSLKLKFCAEASSKLLINLLASCKLSDFNCSSKGEINHPAAAESWR